MVHLRRRSGQVMQVTVLRGGLRLFVGEQEVSVSDGCQRPLAFLAVSDGVADRRTLSGALWRDLPQARADANLRTCLWRLRCEGIPLVATNRQRVRLAPGVHVDYRDLISAAQGVLGGSIEDAHGCWRRLVNCQGVLEGWSDDWLVLPREHFRQLRLQALECLARLFTDESRLGQALECGYAALASDPLRESALRAVVDVHLRQGNYSEARRLVDTYRRTVSNELGMSPTADLRRLTTVVGGGDASEASWPVGAFDRR